MWQVVGCLDRKPRGDCLTDAGAPTRVRSLAGRPDPATMERSEGSVASGGSEDHVARALGDMPRLPLKVDTYGYLG
jgi:hypothetical protein